MTFEKVLAFLLCLPNLAQAAIFGIDDRFPLQPSSPYLAVGRSTAVAVLSANIEPDPKAPGKLKLDAPPLGEVVCKDERFASEPSLAFGCSGFLVAPDLLATAGHCMVNTGEVRDEPAMHCEVYGWLFDYRPDAGGKTQLEGISPEKYYRCKRIVFAVKDEMAPHRDFALVQLERPVTDRKPLTLASVSPAVDHSVYMIGHPLGVPMVVTKNARVIVNEDSAQTLLTDLDAFDGNSGSAVFNRKHEVVGILVGGTPSKSLYTDQKKQCERYNRCDQKGENCTVPDTRTPIFFPNFPGILRDASEVQKIAPVMEWLKIALPNP